MISRSYQYGIASKQAQVPKMNISFGKSAMLVGCGYKFKMTSRIDSTKVLVANLKSLYILGTNSTLVVGFTSLSYVP